MSNIVPQRKGKNHVVWGKLEDEHRFVVDDGIPAVWIVSGPIFDDDNGDGEIADDEVERIGSGIGRPDATYKVIAWQGDEESLNVRGYIIRQNDTDVDLTNYLVPVNTVEEQTGLDFFPLLDDSVEEVLESAQATTLWE